MQPGENWLNEHSSLNPLRIPRQEIDKLACQAEGVGIFAIGEIPLYDANYIHFKITKQDIFVEIPSYCKNT